MTDAENKSLTELLKQADDERLLGLIDQAQKSAGAVSKAAELAARDFNTNQIIFQGSSAKDMIDKMAEVVTSVDPQKPILDRVAAEKENQIKKGEFVDTDLEEQADKNHDGYLTGDELLVYQQLEQEAIEQQKIKAAMYVKDDGYSYINPDMNWSPIVSGIIDYVNNEIKKQTENAKDMGDKLAEQNLLGSKETSQDIANSFNKELTNTTVKVITEFDEAVKNNDISGFHGLEEFIDATYTKAIGKDATEALKAKVKEVWETSSDAEKRALINACTKRIIECSGEATEHVKENAENGFYADNAESELYRDHQDNIISYCIGQECKTLDYDALARLVDNIDHDTYKDLVKEELAKESSEVGGEPPQVQVILINPKSVSNEIVLDTGAAVCGIEAAGAALADCGCEVNEETHFTAETEKAGMEKAPVKEITKLVAGEEQMLAEIAKPVADAAENVKEETDEKTNKQVTKEESEKKDKKPGIYHQNRKILKKWF